MCKYLNQQLLDTDGRFARDSEYLLTAQYRGVASKILVVRPQCSQDHINYNINFNTQCNSNTNLEVQWLATIRVSNNNVLGPS